MRARLNAKEAQELHKARIEAESHGFSVAFWIRSNDPKKAGSRARTAASWGNRVIDLLVRAGQLSYVEVGK